MPTEPHQYDSHDVDDKVTLELVAFKIDELKQEVRAFRENHEGRIHTLEIHDAQTNVKLGVVSTLSTAIGAALGAAIAILKPGP